jgi:hypothetical protein
MVTFEPVDAALDGVALPVELRVKRWWASATGAFRAAVRVLVGFARDARPDPASA